MQSLTDEKLRSIGKKSDWELTKIMPPQEGETVSFVPYIDAGRAIQKALKIVGIHAVDLPSKCPFEDKQWCDLLESMCGFACKTECACPLRKGVVLITAKENT